MIPISKTHVSRQLLFQNTGQDNAAKNSAQYIPLSADKQLISNKQIALPSSANALLKNEETNQALNKYTSLASAYQSNNIKKDGVNYSSYNAVNEYIKTRNSEFVEQTTKLFGLSVYV